MLKGPGRSIGLVGVWLLLNHGNECYINRECWMVFFLTLYRDIYVARALGL